MAHQDRRDRVAEHEGRHDGGGEALPPILGQRHIARRRQPAELHREQEDQHDAEPEVRRGQAPQRKDVRRIVPDGVFLHRRDDAGRDADQQRNDDRHRGELHGHRQLLQHEVEHLLLVAHQLAEVAGEHALDPEHVLHRDRLIEPILFADLLDHRGIAVLARHDHRGIARQQLLQREDQHRHEEQRRDQLQQALGEEGEHDYPSPEGEGWLRAKREDGWGAEWEDPTRPACGRPPSPLRGEG